MDILIVMAVGALVGYKFFPQKLHKINAQVQLVSIVALVFGMGVALGSDPMFIEQLWTLGYKSLIFAVVPIVVSIIVVYLLTKKLMK